MPHTLDGKTVIVTAARDGVGEAIARLMLEQGARVMLAELGGARCTDDAAPFTEDAFARFAYTPQDKLCIANLIAATTDRFNRIDVLVNAAPPEAPAGALMDLDRTAFDAAMGEAVGGVFQLSRAVARRMMQETREDGLPPGSILHVTTIAGQRIRPGAEMSSVAGAALDQLTRAFAVALAPAGVRVNALAVGSVLSDDLRAALREDEGLRDRLEDAVPLGRIADLDEVARAACFIASDAAGYLTGQVITLDGGSTLLDSLPGPSDPS